ncbi:MULTISPECIES: hypothetical protein [Comamonas]|uniref:hypothetical protein n=1 Tax=Comamonas TaxID=283 RepID=UPI0012BE3F42|nr:MULTISPECIES: hypothetical protein [Comamonas]MEB5966817.1 hypothetical protein [Comamonas testosteroni]MPS96640.1 hypothetical protein [Comamonas sp.]
MDFLGNQSAQLRAMKGQILAQEALLVALIESLDDKQLRTLQASYHRRAEAIKADVLNSMATDALYERLLEQLEKYSKIVRDTP